jgi:hypothetical protein
MLLLDRINDFISKSNTNEFINLQQENYKIMETKNTEKNIKKIQKLKISFYLKS